MSEKQRKERSEEEAAIEREILKGRKFNLAEAIARMAGPGAMKGVSPIPRKQQAAVEIGNWLRQHMPPGSGDLQVVLLRWVEGSELLLKNFEQPLAVLAACCEQILDSEYRLQELVRETDVEWGRVQGERPFFEKPGKPPDPSDPYTFESVRETLTKLIEQLGTDQP